MISTLLMVKKINLDVISRSGKINFIFERLVYTSDTGWIIEMYMQFLHIAAINQPSGHQVS